MRFWPRGRVFPSPLNSRLPNTARLSDRTSWSGIPWRVESGPERSVSEEWKVGSEEWTEYVGERGEKSDGATGLPGSARRRSAQREGAQRRSTGYCPKSSRLSTPRDLDLGPFLVILKIKFWESEKIPNERTGCSSEGVRRSPGLAVAHDALAFCWEDLEIHVRLEERL
jgi:hypothetical protein